MNSDNAAVDEVCISSGEMEQVKNDREAVSAVVSEMMAKVVEQEQEDVGEVIRELMADILNKLTEQHDEESAAGELQEHQEAAMNPLAEEALIEDLVDDLINSVVEKELEETPLRVDQRETLEDFFLDNPQASEDIMMAVAISIDADPTKVVTWVRERKALLGMDEARVQNAAAQNEVRAPAPVEYWQPNQQIGNEDDEVEYSWYQVMMLEQLFENGAHPDAGLLAAMSDSIGLSATKAQAWFAIRRAIAGIPELTVRGSAPVIRQYPQRILEAFLELPEPDENYVIGEMADDAKDKEFQEELKRRMSCDACDSANQKAYRCGQCMTGFCKKCHKGYLKYPNYVSAVDDRIICEFCQHPQREFQKIVLPRM